MTGVLLDTCAIIWFGEGLLAAETVAVLDRFVMDGSVFFSPISAWEIGMLGRPRPDGPRVRFDPGPAAWFERFRTGPGLREARLTAGIAMAAATLPPDIHADPADRFIIATAQQRGIPLVTGDRRIIEYGRRGYLDVIACRPLTDIVQ